MKFTVRNFLNSNVISEKLFFPRKTQKPNLRSFVGSILEFEIAPTVTIGGIFFKNDPEVPTLLFFHGNGEIAEDYIFDIENYLGCGVNLAIVDYRGYGISSGEPSYLHLLEDSPKIYRKLCDWLRKKHFNQQIFVMGRSLGSACAIEIGSHNPREVLGYIFESGFADTWKLFTELFNISLDRINPQELSSWNNLFKIPLIKASSLILHGTKDSIIPISQAYTLYEYLSPEYKKRIVPIEGAHHNNIHSYTEQYFSELTSFIQKEIFHYSDKHGSPNQKT